MEPIILYREDSDLKDLPEEVAAMQASFEITPRRTVEEMRDRLVIGRYSVLPFYKELVDDLAVVGSRLINSFSQHCYIADVTAWAHDLEGVTPQTWEYMDQLPDDGRAFVLKGNTNSHKFLWDTHMFAENSRAAIEVYGRLTDDAFISTQRIIAREFVPLHEYYKALHGLPVTEEYRFFVCCGQIVSGGFYWSNHVEEITEQFGAPDPACVPVDFLQEAIGRIGDKATFYALDVARTADGNWIVIEINDGQQSGISENDPAVLYKRLRAILDGMRAVYV